MARGEHDRPDPSLIVQGSRRPQPSRCIQGDDYPVTPLEELQVRSKGMYSPCATSHSENISIGVVKTGIGDSSSLSHGRNISPVASSSCQQETYLIDKSQPNGDACRDDGTLKDASKMEWPHSPTDYNHPLHSLHEASDHPHLEWPGSPSESGTKVSF